MSEKTKVARRQKWVKYSIQLSPSSAGLPEETPLGLHDVEGEAAADWGEVFQGVPGAGLQPVQAHTA